MAQRRLHVSNRIFSKPSKLLPETSVVSTTLSTHKTRRYSASVWFVMRLLMVASLLSACHVLPKKPSAEPKPVTLPALTQPLPKVSYSISAGNDIEAWRKLLTGTSTTSKP